MATPSGSMADLTRQLVTALQSNLPEESAQFNTTCRRLTARLKADSKAPRKEWADVRTTLSRLSRVSRIRIEDDVASAFDVIVRRLEENRRKGGTNWDDSLPLQAFNIPQHVHFLLELAQPTSAQTIEFAEQFLIRPERRPKSDLRLFREIMSEPAGEEEDVESYFDEEVHEGWTDSESDGRSTPTGEEVIVTPVHLAPKNAAKLAREREAARRTEDEQRLAQAREQLAELSKNAYWRTGGEEVAHISNPHGWQTLSTVPALLSPAACEVKPRAINATQLQRELLFALTGRPGVLLGFNDKGQCHVIDDHPAVLTYTPRALSNLLSTFASYASLTGALRHFIGETLPASPPHERQTRSETREAFASACGEVLLQVSAWAVEHETRFLHSQESPTQPSISTALTLQHEFSGRFFDLLALLLGLLPFVPTPNHLLNTIFTVIESPMAHAIRPDVVKIFIRTASPMWAHLGDWLVKGMPVPDSLVSYDADVALQGSSTERPLNQEFFITRDRDSAWVDEDFWEAGFVVGAEGWPTWLAPVQMDILEGGKARGLLQSMPAQRDDLQWLELDMLISADSTDIAATICDYVLPICQRSQKLLGEILRWDCGLQEHLRAIDGLSLMQSFDVLDDWSTWLFSQIGTRKRWADFQLLTNSLRDSIESHDAAWMNAHAVRARTIRRTHARLSDIRIDYLVPFPLSQVFTASAMDLRSDVFTFLLRLLRARKQLFKVRQLEGRARPTSETRRLGHLRQAAVWILDTLWVWVHRVTGQASTKHRELVASDITFHTLVNAELEQARKLRRFCFQHAESQAALENVEALIDVAETISAMAPSALGLEELGAETPRRRKSHDKDVQESDDSDVEYNDDITKDASKSPPPIAQLATYLHSNVEQLRHEVDELASQGGTEALEARGFWGMLAFALEDWKTPLL